MLHGISEYHNENGYKFGLAVGNKVENYIYGSGFNEAFTELITSIITNEKFDGYTKDFKIILELFMKISNLNIQDIMTLYLQSNEWLTNEIIDKFDDENKSLPKLIMEYDIRSAYSKRKFNPNNVISIILDAIDNKINKNELITNSLKLIENLKELNNYFYLKDYEINNDLKIKFADILDKLGTYKIQNER